jgi:hypothetical protein
MLRRFENAAFAALFGCLVTFYGYSLWMTSYPLPGDQISRVKNHQIKNHNAPFKGWEWGHADPAVAFFTFCLVAVGAVQAALFLWQLKLIRRGLEPAEEAAKAAQETARVSHRSLDEAAKRDKILYRAYISGGGVPEVRITDLGHQTIEGVMGGSMTKHLGFARVPTGSFQVHVNNHGRTPGEMIEVAIQFCNADAVPAEPIYDNRIPHHNWIGPGTQSRPILSVPIPTEYSDPIVYGRFFYHDIFSDKVRWSGFFQNINRETGESQSIPPPSRAYTDWDQDER